MSVISAKSELLLSIVIIKDYNRKDCNNLLQFYYER